MVETRKKEVSETVQCRGCAVPATSAAGNNVTNDRNKPSAGNVKI